MSLAKIKHLGHLPRKERQSLSTIHQILGQPGLLRATFVFMRRRCGRDYCRRCKGPKRNWHASWYIIQSHKGKTRMKFIPSDKEAMVRQWVNRYHEIKKHLNRIADLYWENLRKNS